MKRFCDALSLRAIAHLRRHSQNWQDDRAKLAGWVELRV